MSLARNLVRSHRNLAVDWTTWETEDCEPSSGVRFGQDGADVEVAQLSFRNGTRALRHEVLPFLRLGEGYDFADALALGADGHEPVQSQGDAAVRRRSVLKGFQHVTESGLHEIGRNLEDVLEYLLLQLGLMNTNAATA